MTAEEIVRPFIDKELLILEEFPGKPPRYKHETTANKLSASNDLAPDLIPLTRKMLAAVEERWIKGEPLTRSTLENWRMRERDEIAPKNKRTEEVLNRRLAIEMENWSNEIAIDSGIGGNGAMHIDLVHEIDTPHHFELIELKWDSNTPLYAAVQVAVYGICYCVSRKHSKLLGDLNTDRPLLSANKIDLRVLAPNCYYNSIRQSRWFRSFETELDKAVRCVALESVGNGFEMSFSFSQFPADFDSWTIDEVSDDIPLRLRNAIEGRCSVFND